MFDFPTNPPIGTSATTPDGAVRYWDGVKWDAAYAGPAASPDISTELVTAQNASTARTLAAHFADRYSVRDWGALCDGTTDDYTAFMAAITSVLALPGGGIITIPAGRMIVGSAVVVNVPAGASLTLEGVGAGSSEIYFSNATDGLSFRLLNSGSAWGAVRLHAFALTRGPTSPLIANTGLKIYADDTVSAMWSGRMSFRDLVIRGSVIAGTGTNQWNKGMILQGVNGCSVDNVQIRGINSKADVSGNAIDLGDVGLTITGIQVGGSFSQYAVNNNIINCGIVGCSVGLLVSGYVQGVAVANTTIIGQYDGIRWVGGTGLFAEELDVANISLNAIHRCIYISQVNQCSVVGTTFLHYNNATVTDWAGIELNNSGYNSVVGNNTVGALTTTIEYGVLLSDCGHVSNAILGNVSTNIQAGAGVYCKGTTNGATVVGNAHSPLIVGGLPTNPAVAQDIKTNPVLGNTLVGVAGRITSTLPMGFTKPDTGTSSVTDPLAGNARWFVGNKGNAESGANSGSDFEILAAADDGTLFTNPALNITRATGLLTLGTVPQNATSDANAAALTPPVPVGGIYRNGSVLMIRVV